MIRFDIYVAEYRKQLEKGEVVAVYKGLMEYFAQLKLQLEKNHPDYFLSSGIHEGQMDYTYFYFCPKTLRQQKLKVVILFTHATFNFQVLLAGYNKVVQAKYWKLLKENGWNKHPIALSTRGVDYITQRTLIDKPDFSNLDVLTNQIEAGALAFIKDVESFLANQKSCLPTVKTRNH
jgi:hypothetical protein